MPAVKSFAWSWSVLDGYENCPKRHYHLKVAKDVFEKPSPQMLEGNKVHKALEDRVGEGKALPPDYESYEPVATSILTAGHGHVIETERKMALNADFEPVTFFDKSCWVRAITDVGIIKSTSAFIGDYKTGKPGKVTDQLALCAAATFAHHPYLQKIVSAFIFLKDGSVAPQTFERSDVPGIWQEFMPRVKRLEHATEAGVFPPRPSGLCREYCPVPRSKCEHSGRPG